VDLIQDVSIIHQQRMSVDEVLKAGTLGGQTPQSNLGAQLSRGDILLQKIFINKNLTPLAKLHRLMKSGSGVSAEESG
jgi:hypothetical protein